MMKRFTHGFILASCMLLGLLVWGSGPAHASTAYGDLNNFDVVNDTGQECHGFEIEIEDVHSTDVTYTYDWNHYGAPTITEDNSNPAHPKVVVRYAAKYAGNSFTAFTAVPVTAPSPTNGHQCTNPSVNFGCEHFGVGYYGTPSIVRYHWLIDDPSAPGNLIQGPAVNVATPSWTYYAPAAGLPAQVQAVILAPPPPPAPVYEFGDAMWVKAIVTTSHSSARVELKDLVSDDPDDPNDDNWRNGEPDEVEVEWYMLQTEFSNPDGNNNDLVGAAEDLADGDEVVTRRYEFHKYAGAFDEESNEALCDNYPAIDDPNDPKYKPECDPASVTVLGDYIGAQMAGFNVEAVLGLIDHVQDGDLLTPYTDRTVVVGGNTPYVAQVTAGALPPGMTIDSATGVLSGTPSAAGLYSFAVTATDADSVQVDKAYTLVVDGLLGLCDEVVCTASDDCHEAGVCDPATGLCAAEVPLDDQPCDDDDSCTQTDTCHAGVCGGTAVVCTASDQCHVAGVCDPGTGMCSNPAAVDGTSCDGGDACAADSCLAGACQAASCPSVDAVVLPIKPVRIIIGVGKASLTKKLAIKVRNADQVDRTIALTVDDDDCPNGVAGDPDFVSNTPAAETIIVVGAGKTVKAILPLVIDGSAFTSLNLKAPARCTLQITAAVQVDGGSNEATPDNNRVLVELSVVDKNDTEQATAHETTIKSAKPVALTIAAGETTAAKPLKAVIGNADYVPASEKPGDAITLSATSTCPGLTLSAPACDRATGSSTVTVAGGKTKACRLTVTADASGISTGNAKSPQRCFVRLTATGPSDEVAPLDASNNSTELVVDVVDNND